MHQRNTTRPGRHARSRLGLLVFAVVAAISAAGCQTLDVTADWDPNVDFMRLQTWKWAPEAQIFTGNTTFDTDGLLSRRITNAIGLTLKNRGYVETQTDQADFQVAWFLTVEDKTQVTTVNDYHGYGGRYGWYGAGYGAGYGTSQTMVDTYQQGTLIIDIKDGTNGELIWRGSGSARLKDKPDPATAQARVNEAVESILAKFPPPSPKKK